MKKKRTRKVKKKIVGNQSSVENPDRKNRQGEKWQSLLARKPLGGTGGGGKI